MSKSARPPRLTPEQALLVTQLRGMGMDAETEVAGVPGRRFRIDVVARRPRGGTALAIEIDGGLFLRRGRHSGGVGQLKDMEKHNLLVEHGWRVLRFTPQQVRTGEALEQIRRCL